MASRADTRLYVGMRVAAPLGAHTLKAYWFIQQKGLPNDSPEFLSAYRHSLEAFPSTFKSNSADFWA